MLMASTFSQKRRELVHIRGFYGNNNLKKKLALMNPSEYNRDFWNPLLFAVEQGHLHVIRFFVEWLRGNISLLLQGPVQDKALKDIEMTLHNEECRCFAACLAIFSN